MSRDTRWAGSIRPVDRQNTVVLTDYARHGMLIRFVGTHAQYDEIENIEHL